jgi:hypothetical protein
VGGATDHALGATHRARRRALAGPRADPAARRRERKGERVERGGGVLATTEEGALGRARRACRSREREREWRGVRLRERGARHAKRERGTRRAAEGERRAACEEGEGGEDE